VAAARLAQLIRERQPVVALTGAGVSTESGIPDFRSADGIWARYDPMEYATIEAFRRDPRKVWEFYGVRLRVLAEAEPNDAHLALAELESRGLLQAVVTQNIDALHERAGSKDVVEVHGSIREAVCLVDGTRVPRAEVVRLVDELGAPPCPRCGAILKPDVVMFGELLPGPAIDRRRPAAQDARRRRDRGDRESRPHGLRLVRGAEARRERGRGARVGRRGAARLGGGAAQLAFVDHASAARADRPHHFVRDACLLTQRVNDDQLVRVLPAQPGRRQVHGVTHRKPPFGRFDARMGETLRTIPL
jgi:NAD-dependent deacetylase